MEDFIHMTKLIKYKKDYPKTGINFANLSRVITSTALRRTLSILCANLGVDRDWVLVGVPTRGCSVSLLTAIASDIDPTVVQLQKGGAGTLMPESVELCASGTVYSGDKRTSYMIEADDAATIRDAHTVVVCDDVIESGETMTTIIGAIRKLAPSCRVVALCLLQLLSNEAAAHMGIEVHSVMYQPTPDAIIRPSDTMRCRPTALGVLRGANTVPRHLHDTKCVAVYGMPSMTEHVLSYVNNTPNAFVGLAKWNYFPGGCPNFYVHEYKEACGTVFLFDASSAFEAQVYMVRELARVAMGPMRIIILYMPQATMERVDVPGTVATAKHFLDTLCDGLPPVAGGRIKVEVFDIHCTSELFFAPSNVRITAPSALRKMIAAKTGIVAFPDAGAANRFGHEFRGFTHVTYGKKRFGAQRTVDLESVVGPLTIQGNEVILPDDLVRTGGTLMSVARDLKKRGAFRVHVVFVHADFEPGRMHAFAACKDIDTFTCSDSCLQKAYAFRCIDRKRIFVKSVFGFTRPAFEEPLALMSITAVASLDDAKNTAAFSYLDRTSDRAVGLLSFAVDSRVPEQPVGDEQGVEGAKNRLACVSSLFDNFPQMPCIAFESFMRHRENATFVDTICALMLRNNGETIGPAFVEGAVPPHELASLAIERGMVVGDLLKETYNLATKASWIDSYSTDNSTREEQMERALALCDPARYAARNQGGR